MSSQGGQMRNSVAKPKPKQVRKASTKARSSGPKKHRKYLVPLNIIRKVHSKMTMGKARIGKSALIALSQYLMSQYELIFKRLESFVAKRSTIMQQDVLNLMAVDSLVSRTR